MKRVLQKVFFVLLSFVLSLLLAVSTLLCILQATVFDKDFFRRQIDKSMYVENLMESLRETFISYGQSSGFDEAVFREAVSMDMLRADVYREISGLYEDADKRADAALFLYHLDQRLLKDMEEQGLTVSTEDRDAVYYLARVSAEAYVDIVSLPFAGQIHSILGRLGRLNTMGLIGLGVLDLVCIALLFFCVPSRRKRVEGVMHATAGAFLIVCVPTLLLTRSDVLKRAPLTGKALYEFSQQYMRGVTQTALVSLGVLAVIWLCALIYFINYVSTHNKTRRTRDDQERRQEVILRMKEK